MSLLPQLTKDMASFFPAAALKDIPNILERADLMLSRTNQEKSVKMFVSHELLKDTFPKYCESKLFVSVKNFFDSQYSLPGNFPWPAAYYKIGTTVCLVELSSPGFFVVRRGFNLDHPEQSFMETVKGVPHYILDSLKNSQMYDLIEFIKESQIHMARLYSLAEFHTLDPWVAMIKDELQTAVLKSFVSQEGYALAHWHAIHAAEKILKAFVIANKRGVGFRVGKNPLSTNSHDISEIAKEVTSITGVVVPNSLIDPLAHSHNLRYKVKGAYQPAFEAQLKTLRLISWAYPALVEYLGFDSYCIEKILHCSRHDALLCEMDYPGLATLEDWQEPERGLYNDPFTIEVLEQLALEQKK